MFACNMDWSAVGAIAALVAAVVALIGAVSVIFVRKQLRLNVWLHAQEIWMSKEFVKQRRDILREHYGTDKPPILLGDNDEAEDACRATDAFARLERFLDKGELVRDWGRPIAKLWVVLEETVICERKKSDWPAKWAALEEIGEKALKANPDLRR